MLYVDREKTSATRSVRPLGLFYWGSRWSLAAWCELRQGFRSFRLDRIDRCEVREEVFEPEPGRTLEDFFAHVQAEVGSDPR
jgi:predicted DNA-binding transcriptional regulator YafY